MEEHQNSNNDNHEEERNQKRATITVEEIIEEEDNDKMHLMTNFSIEDFKELYKSIEDILAPRSHKDEMLTPNTKFLLTICWCKHAETFKYIAENFIWGHYLHL